MDRVGILRIALAFVAWTGLSVLTLADDWVVDRLRGEVQVLIDDSWSALQRGDIVSDSSRIRSADGSRVTFTRGAEAIELTGATEIRIFDRQGERMTTIMQAYGTVTVEAERLQIQHFSVQTPFLAAIVKGTRFTVHSDDAQSSVDVARGLVQVQDYVHGLATDITPGQSAVVSDAIMLDVSGRGAKAPTVPLGGQLVPSAHDRAVTAQAANHGAHVGNGNGQGNSDSNGNARNGHGNGDNGNHGNGNSGNAGGSSPASGNNGNASSNASSSNGNDAAGNSNGNAAHHGN